MYCSWRAGYLGRDEMPDRELRFDYIPPTQLREVWPVVREGVGIVCDMGSAGWIPEDMYMAIANNHSTLHVCYKGNEYLGFMVLTPTNDYNGTNLHIWATYSNKPEIGILEYGILEINQLACRINARNITFDSKRKGWAKTGEKLGFEPTTTRYAKAVIMEKDQS
jgi:hypothetical protein